MERKRRFRSSVAEPAGYPTHAEFAESRRSFLLRLGLSALAAGGVGSALAACDVEPKLLGGMPDRMHAPRDAGIDGLDVHLLSGKPDAMALPRDGQPELRDGGGEHDTQRRRPDQGRQAPDRRPH